MSQQKVLSTRRVYKYNGVTLVLFKGAHYGKRETSIVANKPVKILGMSKGAIRLVQSINKKKGNAEVWRKVKL